MYVLGLFTVSDCLELSELVGICIPLLCAIALKGVGLLALVNKERQPIGLGLIFQGEGFAGVGELKGRRSVALLLSSATILALKGVGLLASVRSEFYECSKGT